MELFDYQKDAIARMHNGCILCGGVGSGKSITSIAYYFFEHGGAIGEDTYKKMPGTPPDLYVITTAKKRDSLEWEKDLLPFCLAPDETGISPHGVKVTIDSWNNVAKYRKVSKAFFIFDEQRVIGKGTWAESFIDISKSNEWILLTATPGDKWEDYIPVFIANGFYRNRTDFARRHMIISRMGPYPETVGYINEGRLRALRSKILVRLNYRNDVKRRHIDILTDYDMLLYKTTMRKRWNPYTNAPVQNISELCYALRRITNSDISRLEKVERIVRIRERVIIFYCFDYELELLKDYDFGDDIVKAEWNGHKHQPIPDSDKWIYLVQYTAGCEGWNCVLTDTIIFYSQHYSYKTMVQAAGRIDRLNTPYPTLYYYHLKSQSSIDRAIAKALHEKKKFNEKNFVTM